MIRFNGRMTKASSFLICLLCFSTMLLFATGAVAQEWMSPSREDAASHLIKKVAPVYPAFARVAGIEGVVSIQVGIYQDGRIHSVGIQSGPPALRKAATDAVMQYVYRPFQKNGRPINASTTVDVLFKLPTGVAPSQHYPVPELSRANFIWNAAIDSDPDVSAALQKWLVADLHKKEDCDRDCSQSSSADGTASDPENVLPAGTIIAEIKTTNPVVRLYVASLRKSECCGATGNCPMELVEENTGSFRRIAMTFGTGFYAPLRQGSTYPEIFIASHQSAGEMGVDGYSNVSGQWGQLYCGNITINDDQHEKNNVRVCK